MTDHRSPAVRHPAKTIFGTDLVAMVTPMRPDGSVDDPAVLGLVDHLLAGGCDGLVVAGTTGEAPTLADDETVALVSAVVTRAAGRARVVAGVGTYDTAAKRPARAGGRGGRGGRPVRRLPLLLQTHPGRGRRALCRGGRGDRPSGAVTAKAALVEAGVLPHPAVRLPLLPASPDDVRRLREALAEPVVPV